MRNLMIFTMAGAGAWVMVQHCQQVAAAILPAHSGLNPMSALFFLPALLVGAAAGALLGGLVAPLR